MRFEAARAMYDNLQLRFLDVEETSMSPENARMFVAACRILRGRMTPSKAS